MVRLFSLQQFVKLEQNYFSIHKENLQKSTEIYSLLKYLFKQT